MEADNIPDNLSLAASSTIGSTLMTRYTSRSMNTAATGVTRRTSKNKRREERKRARGKKGSIYEEDYLVASMGRLFERVNAIAEEEVTPLVYALYRRGMRQRAAAVQTAMVDVTRLCLLSKDQVFETSPTTNGQVRDREGQDGAITKLDLKDSRPDDTRGAETTIVRSTELDTSSARSNLAPLIKPFTKLGLLS